jgi:hypothetical protein
MMTETEVKSLLNECEQLIKIIAKSIVTAEAKL